MDTINIVIIVAGLATAIVLSAIAELLGAMLRKHRIALEEFRKTANVDDHHQESVRDD